MKKLNLEIKYSLMGTILIGICLYSLSFYEDFFMFQEHLISLIPTIIGIIVTIIGVILTGLALLISFFDKRTKEHFNKEHIEMALNWFVYISKVSGIYVILLIILFMILISKKYIILEKVPLYIITLIYVYYFLYIIFYLVSVIKNIVSLFRTNNNLELYEKITTKNNIDALFIQQEIIFKILIENHLIYPDDIKNKIIEILKNEDEEKREYLLEFFSKYYNQNFREENKS